MEVKVVIDGVAYEFQDYIELRELLDSHASSASETSDDNGVYFP